MDVSVGEPRAEQTQPLSKAKAAGSKRVLCSATIDLNSPTLKAHRSRAPVSDSHDVTVQWQRCASTWNEAGLCGMVAA